MLGLWQINLNGKYPLEILRKVLDDTEKARADRFCFEQHYRQFVISHAASRFILTKYCTSAAAELIFTTNQYGKPALRGRNLPQFNLSHTEGRALFAISDTGEVGVDIEKQRPLDFHEMAKHFFSKIEYELLEQLPLHKQQESFFSCWTRKEAYIKAKGLGLSLPLSDFTVEPNSALPARLLTSHFAPEDVTNFQFWNIDVPDTYQATLAYDGCLAPAQAPQYHEWQF